MTTKPPTADEILESHRKYVANRSPRQAARDEERSEFLREWEKRSFSERVLEAARRLNKTEAQVVMHRQLVLAVKDTLTEDDKDELMRTHCQLADHPAVLPLDVLMSVENLESVPWLIDERTEKFWSWQWWANHFGESVRVHCGRSRHLTPEIIDAIEATDHYPPGWMPETRRG